MSPSLLKRMVVAVLCVAAATLLRFLLSPLLGTFKVPYITYFLAVVAAAWYGGFVSGIATVLLSLILSAFLFLSPTFSLQMSHSEDIFSLVVFMGVGTAIAAIGEANRRAVGREQEGRQLMETTLRSIGDAVIATDAQGHITFMNPLAGQMTGWQEAEAEGRPCSQVFVIRKEGTDEAIESPVDRVLREGIVVGLANHTVLLSREGKKIPIDDSGAPIRDADGHLLGAVLVFRDITEQQKRMTEIERLNTRLHRSIRETHHRVKNNLQIISAMLDMQTMQYSEQIPIHEIARLRQHIKALAAIHDLLTHQAKRDHEVSALSVRAALDNLMPMLRTMTDGRQIEYTVDDLSLPISQVTTLTVLVNELVSNAVKHGKGKVSVRFAHRGEDQAVLEVCDEGAGFPSGFDASRAANTGLDLIESLTRYDLAGQVNYGNRPEGGGMVSLSFPVSRSEREDESE